MNLDAKKVSRSVFTFWIVIGNVGALNGVLISFSAVVLSIFAYQKSLNHLVSQLYWTNDPEASEVFEPQTKIRLNAKK
jgi:hypothetical protein